MSERVSGHMSSGPANVQNMERRLPVIELFGPTIQGEGLLLGVPTHFLRLGGCTYNCTWCDSMHAVDPAQIKANRTLMTPDTIVRAVSAMPKAPWLTLTGGDPCIHKELGGLIGDLHVRDYAVCVETQGELWPDWLKLCDVVTFSPKPPSSGNETDPTDFRDYLVEFRQEHNGRIAVKVVVRDEKDLAYAFQVYDETHQVGYVSFCDGFWFQVCSPLNSEIPAEVITNAERMAVNAPIEQESIVELAKAHWKRSTILHRYEWLVQEVLKHVSILRSTVHITPQVHTLLWPNEERGR